MLQDLIFFKNTSTLDETLYASPMGRLSVRQTLIVGGGCGTILLAALGLYGQPGGDGAGAPLILLMLPVPLALGLYKPKILTADQLLFSVVVFLVRNSTGRTAGPRRPGGTDRNVRHSSKHMGYHPLARKPVPRDKVRIVTVADLARPTRLKLTILRPDGGAFANHFVSIYLDGTRVTAMTTDSAGEVEALVTPGTEGICSLRVAAKGYDRPVLDGRIKFVRG